MSLQKNRDYVFSPKGSLLLNGITTCAVLGTPQHIFLFPLESQAGAGMTLTTTTTSIDGGAVVPKLTERLEQAESIEAIESWVTQLLTKDLGLDPKSYILSINQLEEFDIKFGLLSKGLYYKTSDMKRRNAIGGISKENLQAFKEFYGR